MPALTADIVHRLLLSKHLLSGIQAVPPTSDALTVARSLLTAHDVAELALATVAEHLGVPRKPKMFLMEYAVAIREFLKTRKRKKLSGYDFLARLNDERISFKHAGSLPNVPQWHSVGRTMWKHVAAWCHDYLRTELSDLDLDALMQEGPVRQRYQEAKDLHAQQHYKEALEHLAMALFTALQQLPGIFFPVVGTPRVEDALRLAGFGVNAGDYLTLQQLLPSAWRDAGEWNITWHSRKTGHPANWSGENVRFCLATFVEVAVKIQHAPWCPWPVEFSFVYTDTATAKHDGAALWRVPDMAGRLRGETLEEVRRFNRGDVLRGILYPQANPRTQEGALSFALNPEFENATAYSFSSREVSGLLFVEDFTIGYSPKDIAWVRRDFPHIFPENS